MGDRSNSVEDVAGRGVLGLGDTAFDEIVAPDLADYVSPLFESVCQDALPVLVDRHFLHVGQWWFKEHELDLLGLTREGLVAGECKFTSAPVGEGVLAELERTVEHVQWGDAPADTEPLFVLFSRAGYTDDLQRRAAERDDIRLFGLTDVVEG